MVRGQCNQILMYKMKHNPYWDTASTSYYPLNFMDLLEYQYPLSTVYE